MEKQSLLQTLLDIKAISFSLNPPFTFASGIQSPIYCDNRLLISNVEAREKFVTAFCEMVPRGTEQIAAVATAGITWGAWIADKLSLPLIYIRSKPKAYGQSRQIEGNPLQGETLVVEDLISTGGSSLTAVEVLRDEHVHVNGVASIFNYHFEDTKKRFKESEVHLYSILELEDMIAYAKERSYLSDVEVRQVIEWQKNPSLWKSSY